MHDEKPRYRPAPFEESPRFVGLRTFMRLPHVPDAADADCFVVGIPFDTGATFRVGARFGPSHVREQSLLLRPYHYEHGLDIFDHCSAVDAGDLAVVPGFTDASFKRIQQQLEPLLQDDRVPICLGGDHSISLPVLRALHSLRGPVALLHFDAHGDTWDQYWGHKYTHGTVFRRAVEEGLIDPGRTIQVGLRGPGVSAEDYAFATRVGFQCIRATELHHEGTEVAVQRIREALGGGPIHLSFDIDVFDPAYAPGTGTPEVAGLTPPQVLEMLRGLAGIEFVGFDVVEVLPSHDPAGVTGLLAANLVWEFMALLAMRKRRAWWFHEFEEAREEEPSPPRLDALEDSDEPL